MGVGSWYYVVNGQQLGLRMIDLVEFATRSTGRRPVTDSGVEEELFHTIGTRRNILDRQMDDEIERAIRTRTLSLQPYSTHRSTLRSIDESIHIHL